jgi:hypothetical protein
VHTNPNGAISERGGRAKPDSKVRPEAREKIADGNDRQADKDWNRARGQVAAADQARQYHGVQPHHEQNDPKHQGLERSIEDGRAFSQVVSPREPRKQRTGQGSRTGQQKGYH